MTQLRPYQLDGIDYLKKNKKAFLAWEMRLGKTLTVLRTFNSLPGIKLVVCPKPVIEVWCEAMKDEKIWDYTAFSSSWRENILTFLHSQHIPAKWLIANFEAVQRLPKEILETVDTIIVDESVRLKSPNAKTTKFFLDNFKETKRKVLLSGNPNPNSDLDLFTQMQFLHGSWMNCDNYWQFRQKFFKSDLMGWQFWARTSSKETIKIEFQKSAFILKRKAVGLDCEKIYEKRYVDMPKHLKKEYKRMEKEFVATLPKSGEELETNQILAQLSYLQQMAGGHLLKEKFSDFKVKELVNLLEGELKGEQVVVWCRFRWEIEQISKALMKKVPMDFINGSVPIPDRKEINKEFKEGRLKVLVMQIQTGRYGLNLSSADTAIYFSNTFSSDDRTQSEDRILDVKKKQPLLYVDLITRDSVDEHIHKVLKRKKKNSDFVMEVTDELKKKYVRND